MPALLDMLGAFAVHIGENDGVNPVIGPMPRAQKSVPASPQAVMTACHRSLDKIGYKITDIDRYALNCRTRRSQNLPVPVMCPWPTLK